MANGLGVAALVFSIIAIFLPVVSLYVVWMSLVFAASAAACGERPVTIVAVAICLANVLFLTPLTTISDQLTNSSPRVITGALFVAAIVMLVFKRRPAQQATTASHV